MSMLRGTFQLMKSVNKSLVLNKIRQDSPISRAQIAKEIKLTPPTVSAIVKELIAENIVKETRLGKSLGGRKPTMLEINHAAFYIIGVDAGPNTIDAILTDLSGKILQTRSSVVVKSMTGQSYLRQMVAIVSQILSNVDDIEKVLGIGIAMHGVIDTDSGVSVIAPNLGLKNMPIKSFVEAEFGIEVIVENDARAMALGESWFGNHRETSNMMTVNIGNGVGAGLVVKGNLYHGADDIAGEIGHMTIDIHGDMCDCGNRGCLQALISGPAIARKANEMMQTDQFQTGLSVYQAASKGNKPLLKLFEEVGLTLGIGLTNVIHIANPGLIVIGGGVSNAERLFLNKTKTTIQERALTEAAKQTPIVVSELGDNATILGAIALILVEVFE